MKNKIFLFLFLTGLVVLSSCEQKIDEFKADANGVNFSKFVSVGNSLTAGYADGALYSSGQEVSIPKLISQQLAYVGGGNFNQPMIATDQGVGINATPAGLFLTTKRILKLVPDKDCAGVETGTYSLKPALLDPAADQQTMFGYLTSRPVNPGPYNNLGVPGAMLQHIFFKGYGSALGNPFYARFATTPLTSILEEAIGQQPTFFYLWIGNNDVLTSSLAGTSALVTPVDTFAKYYPLAAGALAQATGNKGVVATIPPVTAIPFFTTISKSLPYNGVVLTADQAAGLNTLYSMYGHPDFGWHEGQNPFVIAKEDGSWVKMGPKDQFLLTLPTDSLKCKGMGVADQTIAGQLPRPYPIPGRFVLDESEQAAINATITAYNQVIIGTATQLGLAVADMNAYMVTLQSGMIFNGIKMNTEFVSGGVFSTDGIHLTPRGNALAANKFIEAINLKYGCTIPMLDITKYHSLIFP